MDDPPVFAPAFLIRRLLSRRGRVELLYSGDRMWSAIRHGQRIVAVPLAGRSLSEGQVVLAAPSNVLDVLRVERILGGSVLLGADADPAAEISVAAADLLAQNRWHSVGVDFSPALVALARERARRLGLAVDFHLQDLRKHEEAPGSLDAVLFSFDVYSFISGRESRIRMLERMAGWLKPAGAVLLSARQARGACDRLVVTLQCLSVARREERRWGASHARWIAPDGTLHRSFVKVFTEGTLRHGLRRAGFSASPWQGGHLVATRDTPK